MFKKAKSTMKNRTGLMQIFLFIGGVFMISPQESGCAEGKSSNIFTLHTPGDSGMIGAQWCRRRGI
ncbi:hypothetical protein DXF96_08520 [Heyndrickxia coagulans]|jgi:hypothetical protein|nr:hypothetical protein BIZ35_16915 [Heyndrickxia coagulans]ATW84198.1 hypothetical protein CIW84_15055 [Heyndrickxia coagulans]AWP36017.1 hypothetical protein CYJ15_02960 [Heyndrickxia coagulans]KGB30486.1 hypothetical protein IE89_04665 [Heyndrickxia coagulans]KXT20953.1 hypothetical protein UZ35_06860 [Heyndrickxia coagulans]